MGEDALRVLNKCIEHYTRMRTALAVEAPQVRAAAGWAVRRLPMELKHQ